MKCTTIAEVITALDSIIETCKQQQDPLGYFAVLYRKVTKRVQVGILNHEFEDNSRMERLDVLFANRYLEAYSQYKSNQPCTASWKVAFDACREGGHIILQHLLLGMNAHINLDLGIAAYAVTGPESLQSIHGDFNRINIILAELVDQVKSNLGSVSPIFKMMMPLAAKLNDEMFVNFSIQAARDGAWLFATELSLTQGNQNSIQRRDTNISLLASKLRNPGYRLSWILRSISLAEWRSVSSKIVLMEL